MNINQFFLDKAAIALSTLCALHCLVLPILIGVLPSIGALGLGDEMFHKVLLFAVIPLSVVALGLGCQKHKKYVIALFGGAGLLIMIFAATLGHDLLGENGEKALTVLGASLIAFGHWRNYRLCRELTCSSCNEQRC